MSMKNVQINVNGKAYPCSPTMGAMLRFKRETGREITEIDPGSFSDLCTYLWCCVVSASKREGLDFDMPLLDFADCISPDEMAAWNEAVTAGHTGASDDAEGEKKSPQESMS